jgi:hypothetical protein
VGHLPDNVTLEPMLGPFGRKLQIARIRRRPHHVAIFGPHRRGKGGESDSQAKHNTSTK